MPVLTFEQVAPHLVLPADTSEAEQAYVMTLVAAAIDYAEMKMGTTLEARARSKTFQADERIVLDRGPVISITSITGDNAVVITDFDTQVVGLQTVVTLNVSVTYPVTVVYQAGYASADEIPAAILLAIKMHVATLYLRRESIVTGTIVAVTPHGLDEFYKVHKRSVGVG